MDDVQQQTGGHYVTVGFGQSSGEIRNVNPPPVPKPRKPARRLTPEERAVMLEKRKNAIPEILGPLIETPDGRKMYENYEIALENGNYICLTCGFITGPQYKDNWKRMQIIKMHIKAKHLNAYRCDLCEKNFTTHKCHKRHLKLMHAPDKMVPVHLCDLCGKSVSDMEAHLWSHKSPEERQEVIQSGKGFAILPCDKCGKEVAGFDKLAAHQAIWCKWRELRESVTESSNRKCTCPTCGKEVFLVNLARHEWTHKNADEKEESARLGTAPLVRCGICSKLVDYRNLKKHLECHHKQPGARAGGERTYFRCKWEGCGRKFKEDELLTRHVKIEHEGVLVASKSDLKSGVVSLRCPDPSCSSRRFTSQANLQGHIGRRHEFKVRAERPFKCDICQARFLIRGDLTRHLKNHLPREQFTITCPQCPMLFARSNILRTHLTLEHSMPKASRQERQRKLLDGRKLEAKRLPEGDKAFKCDICKAGFLEQKHLSAHMKKHRPREEYTFPCPHCPVLYATAKGLRCHLTQSHAVPIECNKVRQRRYHELRKQAKMKKTAHEDDKGHISASSRTITRSRSKRVKIEHIPDEEIEIKQEEGCPIRDVLSSEGEGDQDDDIDDYGTQVEIKSEDEESDGDFDLDNLSPFSNEIKSEHDSDCDMGTESEYHGFRMLTFDGNSSSDDDRGDDEDPLKL